MKVLALNCSPNMDKGNTSLILTPFLDGMREAGAEVELFYTRNLDIKPCTGEFNCWLKTPGECFQKDDMQMLYPKMLNAEIWVFATPVYVDGITGSMKNLLDRIIPLVEPLIELRDGHSRHPLRQNAKQEKFVLVSNCGFWEMDNFEPLLVHMKAVCKNASVDFAGALLRPHGGGLRNMMESGMPVDDIFIAAKDAGRQLVRNGEISASTLATISRELMPREAYVEAVNEGFRRAIEALEK